MCVECKHAFDQRVLCNEWRRFDGTTVAEYNRILAAAITTVSIDIRRSTSVPVDDAIHPAMPQR
jgi:hypothetical protein